MSFRRQIISSKSNYSPNHLLELPPLSTWPFHYSQFYCCLHSTRNHRFFWNLFCTRYLTLGQSYSDSGVRFPLISSHFWMRARVLSRDLSLPFDAFDLWRELTISRSDRPSGRIITLSLSLPLSTPPPDHNSHEKSQMDRQRDPS